MIRTIKKEIKLDKELRSRIEWAKLMNNYKNTAEEIILREYIFI